MYISTVLTVILTSIATAGVLSASEGIGTTPAEVTSSSDAPRPAGSAGEEGFALGSSDGRFSLRLRSLVQFDGRHLRNEGISSEELLIRRARLELVGKVYKAFDFRVMPDFAGSTATLLDAWLRWNLSPAVRIQFGKVKLPVGLEREQPREHNQFNEFGYPTELVPNRDIGVSLQGRVASDLLSYYLGVFDGTADGASVVTNADSDLELAGRLFLVTETESFGHPIQLGAGVAGTWGSRQGVPTGYRTVGQQTFFRWREGVINDGTAWRVVPQFYGFSGPCGLLAEYAVSSQFLSAGTILRELQVSAWTTNLSWVLTGEKATFQGVEPRQPITGDRILGGAWQLAVRFTGLEIDQEAFPDFADRAQSSQRVGTAGVIVNWYLNRVVRLSADFHHSQLDGGSLEDEQAVVLRAQLRF